MSQLGRIGGQVLTDNLLRAGVDLAFETDLLYLDVNNQRIGVKNSTPIYDLDVNSNIYANDLTVVTQLAPGNLRINSPETITTSVGGIDVYINGGGEIFHDRLVTANLVLDGNLISSSSNSNIVFDPNGSGTVQLMSDTNITGDLAVSGNISMSGNLTGLGTLTFGDQTLDTVTINTDFTQSIIPGDDLTFAMGADAGDSSARRWAEMHSPEWRYITNGAWPGSGIIPQSAVVSSQLTLDGAINKISAIQSNEDVILSSATGTLRIESVKIDSGSRYEFGDQVYPFHSLGLGIRGFSFNNDGTRVIVLTDNATVTSYTLSVAYDITTIGTSYTEINLIGLGGLNSNVRLGTIYFKPDGTRFYVGGRRSTTNYAVYQYDLSSPWDITTVTYSGRQQTLLTTTSVHRPWLSPDGTKLIVGIGLPGFVSFAYYELATAWNIAGSITFSSTYTLTASPQIRIFAFSSDGLTIYTINVFNEVSTVSLPSAFRPTSGTLISKSEEIVDLVIPSDLKIYNGDFYVSDLFEGLVELVVISDPGNITNLLNTPLTLAATNTGYYNISGTNAMIIPAGPDIDRRASPEVGETRWNTDEEYLECFDGTVWAVSTGGGIEVTSEIMNDLSNVYTLILG